MRAFFLALVTALIFLPTDGQAECRRVIQNTNGTVRVIIPQDRVHLPGETDAQWCQRIFDAALQSDPSLQGRPSLDLDHTDLPPDGTKQYGWRFQAGQIVLDSTVPAPPDVAGFKAWLQANMSFDLRNNVNKAYPMFARDLNEGNWTDFQAGCLVAKDAVPLTANQWTAFKGAITTYKIPVTFP